MINAQNPRLAVFDFDGTLFRAPDPPHSFDTKWYSTLQSLVPPHVPDKPARSWWNKDVVREARKANADHDTYSVLCTGRPDNVFRWRIPELLRNKKLYFDEVHLAHGSQNTAVFKLRVLAIILKRYSHIRHVEIWDDQVDLLQHYVKKLSAAGYQVTPHLVVQLPEKTLYGMSMTMPIRSKLEKLRTLIEATDSSSELARLWDTMTTKEQKDFITYAAHYSAVFALRARKYKTTRQDKMVQRYATKIPAALKSIAQGIARQAAQGLRKDLPAESIPLSAQQAALSAITQATAKPIVRPVLEKPTAANVRKAQQLAQQAWDDPGELVVAALRGEDLLRIRRSSSSRKASTVSVFGPSQTGSGKINKALFSAQDVEELARIVAYILQNGTYYQD